MRKTIFFIFLLLANTLFAEPLLHVKKYTVDDGLSQSKVEGFVQDSKGFMWFCTWNGLDKFDGYSFKNFKSDTENNPTLKNNRINFIAESKYGNIWCRTYDKRAYLFNTENETFIDVLQPTEEKLKQSFSISSIFTLKKGVTWLAAESGELFRISGNELTEKLSADLYSPKNGKIKGNFTYSIIEDPDGDEWIFTDKGPTIVGQKSITSDTPYRWFVNIGGYSFLASKNGDFAQYQTGQETVQPIKLGNNATVINCITVISPSQLAIGTNKGLLIYDTAKKEFRQYDITTETQKTDEVISVYKDQMGELWMYTNSPGVTHFNLQTKELQHLLSPSVPSQFKPRSIMRFIHEDCFGNLWLIPKEGNFCYYDRETKELKYAYTDPNDANSQFLPDISSCYFDHRGFIWFSPFINGGVVNISFLQNNYEFSKKNGTDDIRAFMSDHEKRLWIAIRRKNILIYDANNNFIGSLAKDGSIKKDNTPFNLNPYCMMEDQNGNIWIGTKFNGLYLLKKKENTKNSYIIANYRRNGKDPSSLNNNNIYSIFQDSKQRIWIGTYGGGLNLVEINTDGKLSFIHNDNQLTDYPAAKFSKIRFITESYSKVLLIGTTDGLLTFSSEFKSPGEIRFFHNECTPGSATSLSNNDIMHIFQDSRNDIYLTTCSGGINKIISKNLLSNNIEFKTYNSKNGLASDLSLSMIEDRQGFIWIVTETALSKFNPKNETFENFNKSLIQQNFIFSEAIPIEQNGQFLLGTETGIVKVDPQKMKESPFAPPITFTSIKVQNSEFAKNIVGAKELIIKPRERNIHFQFAALDFVNPDKIRYAYRLEGLENDWNYVDRNRSASYINLPKGEYLFEVKSTNSDGAWTNNMVSIPITVLPTFWETPLAWILYLILFSLLIFIIVSIIIYIYQLKHQVDFEKQLTNIKLQFFTNISHELRTPLTLISSPVSEVLEHEPLSDNAKGYLELVQSNTERMLRLVNQILDFQKIQTKKMKLIVENIDIIDFITRTVSDFQLLAKEKGITLQVQTNIQSLPVYTDKDKFEKILFNLLSNAFKYTPNGKCISVSLQTTERNFIISVKDEGIGIDPTKQQKLFQRFETLIDYNILQPSSGIGLSLVKELTTLLHGSIKVNSTLGKGSEFMVSFPIGRSHFGNDDLVEFILSDSETPTFAPQTTLEEEGMEKNTILLVEDNFELRHFLKNILSKNYHIIEASDGNEGVEKAKQTIPDIIISDVVMPVLDGLDMVKSIKADPDTCHIPIILLSSKTALDDRIKGFEYGIDDYIPKPFSASYLKTRVKSLLEQRNAIREYYLGQFGDKTNNNNLLINLTLSNPIITSSDEQFMQKVMSFVEENIENADITIDDLATTLSLSRTVFYRKLKSLVGLSPIDFVKEMRIKRAIQLIEATDLSFAEIAFKSGFNEPQYFSRCFKKQTGLTPSEYKKKFQKLN